MRTKKNYYLKLSFLKRTENSNYHYDFKATLALHENDREKNFINNVYISKAIKKDKMVLLEAPKLSNSISRKI